MPTERAECRKESLVKGSAWWKGRSEGHLERTARGRVVGSAESVCTGSKRGRQKGNQFDNRSDSRLWVHASGWRGHAYKYVQSHFSSRVFGWFSPVVSCLHLGKMRIKPKEYSIGAFLLFLYLLKICIVYTCVMAHLRTSRSGHKYNCITCTCILFLKKRTYLQRRRDTFICVCVCMCKYYVMNMYVFVCTYVGVNMYVKARGWWLPVSLFTYFWHFYLRQILVTNLTSHKSHWFGKTIQLPRSRDTLIFVSSASIIVLCFTFHMGSGDQNSALHACILSHASAHVFLQTAVFPVTAEVPVLHHPPTHCCESSFCRSLADGKRSLSLAVNPQVTSIWL